MSEIIIEAFVSYLQVAKLISNMILFRLRDAIDNVIREKQCSFRKDRGCVNQIFTLRSIIEKCLSYQMRLVLSFMDYLKTLDFDDRRALAKV